ncbi:AlpA family transcriptional regulator [Sphingomonas sp. PP-F2F-G114-C0414]|uniref:helix-turn-helix transcriptional regulator n=1 Tax=Sphingomonas sp. PP-F2F-G114-C0414 TaxID=2135662 RepID=UPI000EF8B8F8|nr:AlpA family phage regulatory protein [Sphingomonas sp. PP-F2F-G114-C0414]RMB39166.1 AlpA family transcriptional regulator [Sphingomonas sp. PP-F2F-G114-C0414]
MNTIMVGNSPSAPDRILPKAAVASWLGVSASTVDRWTKAGAFPPRLRLGPGRVGWSQSTVQAWLDAR